MGSFSAWHWLTSAPIFLLLLLIGGGLYFALRRRPAGEPAPIVPREGEIPVVSTAPPARNPFQKIVSIIHLAGGVIGLLMTVPQINGVSLGLMGALTWLFLLAQIAAALYGGWQCWHGRPVGFQVLYWVSMSCIPVLSSPLISYWCALGVAVFPMLEIGAGHFGTDLSVRFGYDSSLWLFPSTSGFVLGVNLIALWFAVMIGRTMKAGGVPRWPLALPQRAASSSAPWR